MHPERVNEDVQAEASVADLPKSAIEEAPLDNAGVVVRPINLPAVIPVIILDPLDEPIVNLDVVVEMPDGARHTAATDTNGAVAVPVPQSTALVGKIQVSVKTSEGKLHPVCALNLARCRHGAVIRSNKVKVPLALKQRLSEQASATLVRVTPNLWIEKSLGASLAWIGKIAPVDQRKNAPAQVSGLSGQVFDAAPLAVNHARNPIHIAAGPECPNGDNLRLGRNGIYRNEIIKAARHVGLAPQAVAALINAEAAKKIERIPRLDSLGKPILDPKTKKPKVVKIREVWDKNSYNSDSGAAGLTQFLASTWLSHAMTPGRYLHRECVARGWVRNTPPATDKKPPGHSATSAIGWVFVLATGVTTKRPIDQLADRNVQACLRQRFDAEWSIMAAADYGKVNLALLTAKGFSLSRLGDGEKAKLMYLMHHEGEGNGPLFIQDRLQDMSAGRHGTSTKRMRHIFNQQVGADDAVARISDADGDVFVAYRRWFSQYVDDRIDLGAFSCPNATTSEVLSMARILEKIR